MTIKYNHVLDTITATTGTLSLGSNTLDLSSSGTATLFPTNATTVTAFGYANTINLGFTGNPASSNTFNISTQAQAYGSSKTVNIGTGSAANSTTAVNLGSTSGTSSITANGSLSVTNGTSITYTPSSTTGQAILTTGKDTQGGTGYFDFLKATNTTSGVTNGNKTFRLDSSGNLQLLNSAYTSVVFQVSDAGQVSISQAASSNNDATTNWLSFNNNQTAIYDDGNTHIHNRSANQSIWINTNGGDLRLLQQSPVNGGAVGNSIIMGGSSSSQATAYLNVLGSKSYTVTSYGYLSTSGAGTGGNSGSVGFGIYCSNRIQSGEVDVTSDERLKDVQGTIPLDKALQFVRAVDGILYTWRPGFGDEGLKSGFSAQGVHKAGFDHMIGHIPNEQVEGHVDDDGWTHPDKFQLTMGYNQAIPYHHEVIKHLLNRIEQLEATVAKLTADK
jgi:hypothetical protein